MDLHCERGLVGLLGSCIGYGPSKMDGIVSL